MSCALCPNPALCNPVCRAFEFAPAAVRAQMREACAASGQMTAQEVSAHVEAGEMPKPKCAVHGMVRPGAMCSKVIVGGKLCGFKDQCEHQRFGEAGEMEAAKGDERA